MMDEKVRQLLERIRESADLATDAANHTARMAGKKAGQMVDVAKLNVQLFELNSAFNDLLRQLGQVMYNTHLGQLPTGDPVTGLLRQADETGEKIAQVKQRIVALRQTQTCSACGVACGKEDKFCRHCGATL
jgi:hypothetical protein